MNAISNFRATLEVLRNKQFSAYLLIRFLVIFCVYAQSTAVYFYVAKLTGQPIHLGYLGLAEFLPALLIALPAGWLADKMDKQKLYKYTLFLYILVAIGFTFICSRSGWSTTNILTGIYIIMFVNGVARAMLAPAAFSILSTVAPKQLSQQAITWSTTAWYCGSILGPLASGFLLGTWSMFSINFIVILGLVVSFIAIFAIHPIPPIKDETAEAPLQKILKGVQFVFSNQVILTCLSIDLFAVLFGGAESLLPIVTDKILHASAATFGWLRSAHGIGSLVLLGILTFLPLKTNAGNKLLIAVAGFGICIIGFGLSTNVYLSFVLLAVGGMLDAISVVIRHSVLQQYTPEQLRGRVSSVNTLFISSSNELGALESGIAATIFGLVPSIVFGGCTTIVVCIIAYIVAPQIRKLKIN